MNDDRLLRALGQLAREQEAAPVPDELLAPPDPSARERVVASGLAALAAHGGAAAPERAGGTAAVTPITAGRRKPVGATGGSRRRWFAAAAGSLALAASALLWVGGQGGQRGGHEVDQGPLPRYSMSISGGIAEQRSAAPGAPGGGGAPLLLAPGAPVEVILRPATATGEALEARLFWVKDGRAQPWAAARAERSAEGSLRVRGRAEAPFGPGAGELVAIVGRPGLLPERLDAAQLGAPRGAGWQLMRQPVSWP